MTERTAIEAFLVDRDATLHDAMQAIENNATGIAFIVGERGRLVGVLTDGDVRRSLLKGATVKSAVSIAMTSDCAYLPVDAPREDVLKLLVKDSRIKMLPLVNDEGRPVDYASLRSFHRIPVASPDLGGNELEYVTSCLQDGWISSQGPFVKRFEAEFSEFVGGSEALACSSGTTALHLALEALDIGPGDEVIVPDFTFAASINAVLYCGAKPVLVDVDRNSWNINPGLLESVRTPHTKAVMAVHIYGQPADMDSIAAFTNRHNLFLVEDAAEALGATYRGRPIGSFGDTAAFSFFGNKLITTGEGGMVVAKDPKVAGKIRVLRDHGMNPAKRYWHDYVGYNYRMTNLQAALGVAQLERIGGFIAKKQHIGRRYTQKFSDIPGVSLPACGSGAEDVCWLFSMAIDKTITGIGRDDLMQRLMDFGIETRPLFYPLHGMPPYQDYARGGSFEVSTTLSRSGLSLPSAVSLTDAEIDYVADVTRELLIRSRVAAADA